jgi:hypothetical protein
MIPPAGQQKVSKRVVTLQLSAPRNSTRLHLSGTKWPLWTVKINPDTEDFPGLIPGFNPAAVQTCARPA